MAQTQHYKLPLPDPSHTLASDCDNLIAAFTKIDAQLKTLADTTTFETDKQEILTQIETVRTTLNQATGQSHEIYHPIIC